MRGSAAMRVRPGWRGYGDARPPGSLSLLSGGTFTRSTEGSYLIGAPTDGSSAFLAWAGVDVRRIEDRGDGLGSMLLMEGSRTNQLFFSRDANNAYWTANGTYTDNAGNGPDGTLVADENATLSANTGRRRQGVAGAAAGPIAASAWVRRATGAGAGTAQIAIDSASTGDATGAAAITETYSRVEVDTVIGSSNPWYLPWCGSNAYGGTNVAVDYLADLHQVEIGYFASSPIRTTAAAVTRALDGLDYAVGQYPASFLDRGFVISFAPDCSSAELISAATPMTLINIPSLGHVLRIGAPATLQAYQSSALQGSTSALSWSRGQLISVSFSPQTGVCVVSGATTGNGTYNLGSGASWTAGTMRIGNGTGYSTPFFGRFSPTIVGL